MRVNDEEEKERKKETRKKKRQKEKRKKEKRKNSRKSVTWSAVPNAPMLVYVGMRC